VKGMRKLRPETRQVKAQEGKAWKQVRIL